MQKNSHLTRIGSNYARMMLTFIFGIFLIKLLLHFGQGVYAAFALTASSIGIAEILKEMVRGATIPELGIAYHSKDELRFSKSYASSILLSIFAAVFAVLLLAMFILFFEYLQVSPELENSTKVFIVSRMLYTFIAISLAPVHNMMPITSRMVAYNGWLTLERFGEIAAAMILFGFLGHLSSADKFLWFGCISAFFMISVNLCAAFWSITISNQMVPNLRLASLSHLKKIIGLIGWNGAAVVSVNLYLRFDLIFINIIYGVVSTVTFGLAGQLAAYTRILTMGLITGLDAVVTQRAGLTKTEKNQSVFRTISIIVRLQSIVLSAVAVVLFAHSEFVIEILFANQLNNDVNVEIINTCFLLLMVGMIARGLSEVWMSVLAGIGRIREYAVPVLFGALVNPVIVLLIGYNLSSDHGLVLIALVFMVLNVVFHLIFVPIVTGRVIEIRTYFLVKPILLPVLLAILLAVLQTIFFPYLDTELKRFVFSISMVVIVFGAVFVNTLQILFESQD